MVGSAVLWSVMGEPKLGCAIYTRKSSEEGLDQDFNSLDAQREACEAFVASQAGLGWELIAKRYDDGGISGAHLDRPAVQELLNDVAEGNVNVVVVYKIDRLTRSLTDFAKIVDAFDAQEVSFVSVTQQFNTTTSMGRLTLNVLLSFAQFEREVTAERIRDKIAASKKKGIWMGGLPPLGYDVKDKQLVVNETEAATVRQLFDLYLEVGSVRRLKVRADELELRTKRRMVRGAAAGGRSFSRGHLYQLLANPLYVGRVVHKGETYPGRHQAIIDIAIWDSAQRLLENNAVARSKAKNAKHPSLLLGLVHDETGDRLSPTHANKNGRRYRYYISHRLMEADRKGDDGWRIPARELERTIISQLNRFLSDEAELLDLLGFLNSSPSVIRTALARAASLRDVLSAGTTAESVALLKDIIGQATVAPGWLELQLKADGICKHLGLSCGADPSSDITLRSPFELRKRGVEAKLVLRAGGYTCPGPDQRLIKIVAEARYCFEQLSAHRADSISQLAESIGKDANEVSRILPLAFLAPDIVAAIVEGTQPFELTATKLNRIGSLPLSWQVQRQLLGFT